MQITRFGQVNPGLPMGQPMFSSVPKAIQRRFDAPPADTVHFRGMFSDEELQDFEALERKLVEAFGGKDRGDLYMKGLMGVGKASTQGLDESPMQHKIINEGGATGDNALLIAWNELKKDELEAKLDELKAFSRATGKQIVLLYLPPAMEQNAFT